jgi:hypothetical protein
MRYGVTGFSKAIAWAFWAFWCFSRSSPTTPPPMPVIPGWLTFTWMPRHKEI